ncbi:MAG TPA: carboxypeptidase regulatory-like domain-containing protein [Gemmatimonadales bacterium]|nr:carboxypeptidase regulatory-like domain-containing protein [Gemmatimonadales bacterium]
MTHRVRSALDRFLALGVALAIATVVAVVPLAAQQTTGKVEGTVTDQAGAPITGAQVLVIGTSFGAITDQKGYYFINNVPVGTYSLRIQFIGFQAVEIQGARVVGGQTSTQNAKLQPSAVQVATVNITAASNPIVPRDEVASKAIVSGDLVNNLPTDDVRNVISLVPGVVESGAGAGVSIRGGRPGSANVYIDGAPVRSTNFGSQAINIGTNAVEEASVTTGALGVEFGNAQAGVIAYNSRSGGSKFSGSLNWSTDEPFNNSMSVGYNRFEGSLGGPITGNLRFFVSGVLQGQVAQFLGSGWDQVPTYAMAGTDTNVAFVDKGGHTESVAIPLFVQASGQCDQGSNHGFECTGQRLPYNWSTNQQYQGKLSYSYGSGSSISLSGLANGNQGRNWPGSVIGDPALYSGSHTWSRLAVMNLNHTFFKETERALALNVNLSWGQNRGITGMLSPQSELDTRNPTMGMEFSNLNFAGIGNEPFPITDQVIRNIRSNSGDCLAANGSDCRIPYLNRTDLRNVQPYRMNPYGLVGQNYFTQGSNSNINLNAEDRYRGFGQVDWQLDKFNRLNLGGEYNTTNLAYLNSSITSQFAMDAYVVQPKTYAWWASDRLDLGDVVLELGLRYDAMNSDGLFANTPAFIASNPAWQNGTATNDAAYQASLNAVMTPAVWHHALQPRIRVSFPITERTDFRLSYSQQVNTPDFNTLLSGTNNDISFTNTNDQFGRDVGFGKSIAFEFGIRHAFSQNLVLDVAAYNRNSVSDLAYRLQRYPDPSFPGAFRDLNVLTTADFGYSRGIDLKLDERVGSWFLFSGSYTFQQAKNTGSDPFTYLNTAAREAAQVTGDRSPPAEQPLPTDDNRTHNFVGGISINVPKDWQKGQTLGAILQNVGAYASFRIVSGLPYTRLVNTGQGSVGPRAGFGLGGNAAEALNSSTMPWTKAFDLRVTKGFRLSSMDVTVFGDFRNLFNFKNVTSLFVETGDVVNPVYQTNVLSPEFSSLQIEAQQEGKNLPGGAIDLRPSCSTWTATDQGVVNCVNLRRVEARFGNGDGVYTLDEQTAALNAWYNLVAGPQNFYGPPRSIRVGFELSF